MEYENMLSSGDAILIKNMWESKIFLPEASSRNRPTLKKIEKTNVVRLSAKVAHHQFDGTH